VPYNFKVLLNANDFEGLDKEMEGFTIPKALRNHIEQKRALYQKSLPKTYFNIE